MAVGYNNARDGREALVYFAEVATTPATTFRKGHWYFIKGKAETLSDFKDLEIGHPWFCTANVTTPQDGDSAVEVKLRFLGGAKDKDLQFSKNTTDITCDKDGSQNMTSDGVIASSGSVSGYDLMETNGAADEAAINQIRTRFNDVAIDSGSEVKVYKSKTTEKDILFFIWDDRNVEVGQPFACDIVPCMLTQLSRSSSYGSPQSFDLSFDGVDSDENGNRRMYYQGIYAEPDSASA